MNQLKIITDPRVIITFERYPTFVQPQLQSLRELIVQTAIELEDVVELQETLKWGEPSFITPIGSTLRMDWKEKFPDQYQLYFQCTSKLIPTFKSVFGNRLHYEGTRAIIFKLDEPFPEEVAKYCIRTTLRYHKVKQLPLLGM